ncbi:MAG: hypothetical protein RBS80_26100 [Thermoguttaceae bacterium]|jgi:hypothetical protein|nr:hypothetical protein [Thermoguttaceae bacterium]
MKTATLSTLTVCLISQFGIAAEPAKLPHDTYSGYFVSNKFEPDAAQSFVVLTDQEQFDKVFGVAFVMNDKSHRLPKDAFKSLMVIAAIKRGNAFWEFKVEGVTVDEGVVQLRYKATSQKTPATTFSCPLIVSIPKGKYKAVEFVEDGRMMKEVEFGKGVPSNSVEIRRIDTSRVDITVTRERPFPVNTITVLQIGEQKTNICRYSKNKLNTLVFSMAAEDFAKTQDGEAITVKCLCEPPERCDFGKLDRSKVRD